MGIHGCRCRCTQDAATPWRPWVGSGPPCTQHDEALTCSSMPAQRTFPRRDVTGSLLGRKAGGGRREQRDATALHAGMRTRRPAPWARTHAHTRATWVRRVGVGSAVLCTRPNIRTRWCRTFLCGGAGGAEKMYPGEGACMPLPPPRGQQWSRAVYADAHVHASSLLGLLTARKRKVQGERTN